MVPVGRDHHLIPSLLRPRHGRRQICVAVGPVPGGNDIHVPEASRGDKIRDGIGLKGEIPGIRKGGRGNLDLLSSSDVHQRDVIDGGGVRKGDVPGREIAS